MARTFASLAIALALLAFAAGAEAASQKTLNTCQGNNADAAIKACTRLLAGKLSREHRAMTLNNRGWAYGHKGDYKRAIDDYTHAIELDPKMIGALTNRGLVYAQIDKYDQAIADYTRAIEIDSKSANAFAFRSAALVSTGDYDRAIADASRAIDLDPKNGPAFNNRGRAHLEKREFSLAIDDLNRAIELVPAVANPYRHRGVAYLKLGKLDLARADLEKALKLKPDYEDAKTALAELEQAEAGTKNAAADISQVSDAPAVGLKVKAANGHLEITDIAEGSEAATAGLKSGDVVLEADGLAVREPEDIDLAVAKDKAKGAVLLKVETGDKQRFVALPLNAGPSTPAAASEELGAPSSAPAAPPTEDDLSDLDKLD